MTDQLSDMDLALRLLRALGWPVYETQQRGWRFQYPDLDAVDYPPEFLVTTGKGLLAVLEAMRERTWPEIRTLMGGEYEVCFYVDSPETGCKLVGIGVHTTLPRAVAEAALAALEAE